MVKDLHACLFELFKHELHSVKAILSEILQQWGLKEKFVEVEQFFCAYRQLVGWLSKIIPTYSISIGLHTWIVDDKKTILGMSIFKNYDKRTASKSLDARNWVMLSIKKGNTFSL